MLRHRRSLVALLWVSFAAIVAYWGVWFFGPRGWLASLDTREYVVFENAFPVADAWLAITYAGAAFTLTRAKPSMAFWLIAAGSGSLYLAGMDILFDLENGVYHTGSGALVEIVINAFSLGLGGWCLSCGWSISARNAEAR